jgi:hypothetical protein
MFLKNVPPPSSGIKMLSLLLANLLVDLLFEPEDGRSRFFRKNGNLLRDYTSSQPGYDSPDDYCPDNLETSLKCLGTCLRKIGLYL